MQSIEGDTWTASYWDDILHDFGVVGYIEARYGAQKEVSTMQFTVSFSGTKNVDVYLSDSRVEQVILETAEQDADLSALEDYDIEDADIADDSVAVTLRVTGSTTVDIDAEEVKQLVGDRVFSELEGTLEDVEIEEVEES